MNRFRTHQLVYGEGEEAYPYWEVWDEQPDDQWYKRTGITFPYGPYWEAQEAYTRCRQLNREAQRKGR